MEASTKGRVVALGEAMLRLSPDDFGRLERAQLLRLHVAGSECNVAVGLAQLGFDATWLSRLPDSPLGRRVAAELAAAGVDVGHVRWVPESRLGLFFVEFGSRPRSTTVWYDRSGSAAASFEPDDLDPSVLDGATYAVISGVTPALSDGARRLAERFVAEARRRDVTVCVDVNYRERLWAPDAARASIEQLTRAADVVVCSARDARRVFGAGGLGELRAAAAPNASLLVLTRSSEGCVADTNDGRLLEQPALSTNVVDRFGAGDAFLAGLLWGLSRGDEELALRAAAAAAALKCTIEGDHLVTTTEELLRLVTEDPVEDIVR